MNSKVVNELAESIVVMKNRHYNFFDVTVASDVTQPKFIQI